MLISLPFAVNMAAVILFMPKITYCHGEITNYSMGNPVYTCYIMVAVYMLGSVMLLVCGRKNMGHNKLITITTCIVAALAVTVYQMLFLRKGVIEMPCHWNNASRLLRMEVDRTLILI